MKMLQVNLGRARAAHDLAQAAALREEIDAILISEPNKKLTAPGRGWITDDDQDVAVQIRNKSIEVEEVLKGRGHVCVRLKGGIALFCCYVSPNIPIRDYEARIDEAMVCARRIGEEIIMAGDFNAKASEWGSPVVNARGRYLADWAAVLDLVLINDGRVPTCRTVNGSSYIDVTMASKKTARKFRGWRVAEEEALSCHQYIYFEVDANTPKLRNWGERLVCHLDSNKYREAIKEEASSIRSDNPGVDELMAAILSAQSRATLRAPNGGNKVPYWWNVDIAAARADCVRRRRVAIRATREDGGEIRAQKWREYKEAKKELNKRIRTSKNTHWRELCSNLENDVWGDGYRIAVRHLKGLKPSYTITKEAAIDAVKKLFPQRKDTWVTAERDPSPPLFTAEEINIAARGLKSGTAPGADGVTSEAVKKAVEEVPELVKAVLNDLLRAQEFPGRWKTGRVVLIPKGGAGGGSAVRPICLLSVVAKLYEALIRNRLSEELERNNNLSENQFGFRKGRSTLQAIKRVVEAPRMEECVWCVAVTLDIKNAFNSASWGVVMKKLEDRRVSPYIRNQISKYLCDRCVTIRGETIEMTAGVPQGSVLGPTLWNVLYDDVLRVPLPNGAKITAYADDLAVTVTAGTVTQLNARLRVAISTVEWWLEQHYLSLAPEKTEAVVLKGPRKRNEIVVEIQGHAIPLKREIKYLGVILDARGTWGPHIERATRRAGERVTALNRILPNIGGPGYEKRRVLLGVVHSTLLYGAPIWHEGMRINSYAAKMVSVQRRMLLRVGAAYCTVSAKAAQVITGTPPIHLLVEERCRIFGAPVGLADAERSAAREELLVKWQGEWERTSDVAQWTKSLIPNLKAWVRCKHRRTSYFETQFLSGHGSFRSYTKRIGRSPDDECVYCGERDTPNHTVFACPRWAAIREARWGSLGFIPTANNIVAKMIESPAQWNTITGAVREIMRKKEQEERIHQSREALPPGGR